MALTVTVLGSGAACVPQLDRAQPAFVVQCNGESTLVDCGPDTVRQLLVAGIALESVTRVVFTHLHADHTLGLGNFIIASWTAGRRKLELIGPRGTRHLKEVLLDDLYAEDIAYRARLGRPTAGLVDVDVIELMADGTYEDGGLRLRAAQGVHTIENLAVRLEWGGRTVVFTGDTAPCAAVTELARDADALFHESNLVPTVRDFYARQEGGLRVWESLQDHHSTPEDAGRTAAAAGARQLVLIHFLPSVDPGLAERLAATTYEGPIVAAEDLMQVLIYADITVRHPALPAST